MFACRLRALHRGLRGHDVGLCCGNACFCACDVTLYLGNFQYRKNLSLLNVVADIHGNRLHITGDLRHDIDILIGQELRRERQIVCKRCRTDRCHRHRGDGRCRRCARFARGEQPLLPIVNSQARRLVSNSPSKSLSVQKSCRKIQLCAAAQIGIGCVRSSNLGRSLIELRLIQFDDAAQPGVIAVLRQSQSFLTLRDEPRVTSRLRYASFARYQLSRTCSPTSSRNSSTSRCSRSRFQLAPLPAAQRYAPPLNIGILRLNPAAA